jgi:hypothetical protein
MTTSSEQRVHEKFAFSDIESIRSHSEMMSGSTIIIILAIGGALYLIINALTADTILD